MGICNCWWWFHPAAVEVGSLSIPSGAGFQPSTESSSGILVHQHAPTTFSETIWNQCSLQHHTGYNLRSLQACCGHTRARQKVFVIKESMTQEDLSQWWQCCMVKVHKSNYKVIRKVDLDEYTIYCIVIYSSEACRNRSPNMKIFQREFLKWNRTRKFQSFDNHEVKSFKSLLGEQTLRPVHVRNIKSDWIS